jgi:agmatine deiminase
MPAEWEPHERSPTAWPTDRRSWGRYLDAARDAYASLAEAITRFEPPTMMVDTGEVESARNRLHADVDLVEIPYDSAWARDSGPVVVIDDQVGPTAVDFACTIQQIPPAGRHDDRL